MLRGAADLLDASRQPVESVEDKRRVVASGRQYVGAVRAIRDDIGSLIDRIPRSDYPQRDCRLRSRYEQDGGLNATRMDEC